MLQSGSKRRKKCYYWKWAPGTFYISRNYDVIIVHVDFSESNPNLCVVRHLAMDIRFTAVS
jgi:hypothetical protein